MLNDPQLDSNFLYSVPVGSRVTCNPAPTDTDADYLCMLHPKHHDNSGGNFDHLMSQAGWRLGGSQPTDEGAVDPHSVFWSYTKGEVNLIVTKSPIFFSRFMAATSVAKRLNLMVKADRIALFQAVLYGNATT